MMRTQNTNGMILGMVLGDCLGKPCIFMKSSELLEKSSQIGWEVSEYSTSSRLLFDAIESVYRHGTQIESLSRAYFKSISKGYEIDFVMAQRFGEHRKEVSELYQESRQSTHGALCSNQLLLRQIPIVLAGIGWDKETLLKLVEEECLLTHHDPESIELAQLYALCLQGILQGKSRIEIWDRLFEALKSPQGYRYLLNSYYEKPVCDGKDYSFAHITFGISMYHFWHDTPMVAGIRSVLLGGGATDINAAATGALLGAWQGKSSIPISWCKALLGSQNTEAILLKKALARAHLIAKQADCLQERVTHAPWHASRRDGIRHQPKLYKKNEQTKPYLIDISDNFSKNHTSTRVTAK